MTEPEQRALPATRSRIAAEVSVVVVEHGTADTLERCLASVFAEGGETPIEVVVVDNASPTPCDHLHARFPDARFVHLGRNLGFAGGCAVALGRTRAPIVATVNPDAVLERGWARAILDTFARDARIGVVGSKLLAPDGVTLQHVGGRLFPNGRSEHLGRGERDRGQRDHLEDVDYVCGAALAIRRRTIAEIGFFSPVYHPAYYEDAELCLRARRRGWRVVVAPDARARHGEATASGGPRSDRYLHRYHTGRIRFVARNLHPWRWVTGFVPSELGLLAAMGPRERAICARAWAAGVRGACDEGPGLVGPGDVLSERPPRSAS